jgi:hypothetical protein
MLFLNTLEFSCFVSSKVSDPYTFDTDSDINIFLGSNYNFANSQASIQDVQVTKEAFSSQKSTSKHEISKFFVL